jgi:DNA-binding transcriptional ArsR family regulator
MTECQIHGILANERRRAVIERLDASPGTVTVRDLSTAIAEAETGQSPPPARVRESVYTSLHQTHLPKLDDVGVVEYDREGSLVHVRSAVRQVDRHMDVLNDLGITWGEYYRSLGVFGLVLVIGSLTGLPVVSWVDPLLWASGTLVAFAVSGAIQLWDDRWRVRRTLDGMFGRGRR